MELRTYGRSDNCDNYEDPFPDYSPERFPAWMVHAIEKLAEEQLLEAASESSQEVALDRMTWERKRRRKKNEVTPKRKTD